MKCDEQGPGLVKFNISPWVLAGVEYKCGAREKDTDWSAVLPLKKLPTPRLWLSLYLALCFDNRLPDVPFS